MNAKQVKKFRKAIRTAMKDGLTPEMVDAAVGQVMRLESELKEKQKEINALCEIIKVMKEQTQQAAQDEYEQIPEVLK